LPPDQDVLASISGSTVRFFLSSVDLFHVCPLYIDLKQEIHFIIQSKQFCHLILSIVGYYMTVLHSLLFKEGKQAKAI
jgi:hypothetical protein